MAQDLSFAAFDRTYQAAVTRVLEFWRPEMQAEIAAHNRGWAAGRTDFAVYLRASAIRYHKAYLALATLPEARTVCDVGGFWGAFPLALRELGYEVTMTESLRYYSSSFHRLFEFVAAAGVRVLDVDPFAEDFSVDARFDFVSVMAVLEHYPHSLRTFMANVTSLMAPGAELYVEVPNIAFWPKRVAMLLGRSPLVPLVDIYASGTPFIGHHHEFTLAELAQLAELSELELAGMDAYNYTPGLTPTARLALRHPVLWAAMRFDPSSRELLAARYRRPDGASPKRAER